MRGAERPALSDWAVPNLFLVNLVWHVLMRLTKIFLFVSSTWDGPGPLFPGVGQISTLVLVTSLLLLFLTLAWCFPRLIARQRKFHERIGCILLCLFAAVVALHAILFSQGLTDPLFLTGRILPAVP